MTKNNASNSMSGDAGKSAPPTPERFGDARRPADEASRRVIIDASNVAHAGEQGARLATLLAVRDHVREAGYDPIIVADAALRHQIDERAEYERMVDAGEVQQAPAGTDADFFILSFARELNAAVVSNDQFRDGGRLAEEARRRRIRFMVVAGEVVLERRTSRR